MFISVVVGISPGNLDSSLSFMQAGILHNILCIEAMTNLDSVLKSRDVTLPIKVHVAKAMIFPVVLFRWES